MAKTIRVWCVCVGDKYANNDIHILQKMVSRNIGDHIFICLSDRHRPNINYFVPDEMLPGWWAKLLLFKYAKDGLNLYLDLDTVVVGDLAPLLSYTFSMPRNWPQSGHGGWQSSVMAWGSDVSYIYEAFNKKLLKTPTHGNHGLYGPQNLWGDQEFISSLDMSINPMVGVYSYRYHCRGKGIPEDASVIAFHGEPKPADVNDEWVKCARYM